MTPGEAFAVMTVVIPINEALQIRRAFYVEGLAEGVAMMQVFQDRADMLST